MTRIINFIERLYNSIRYNGFYLILSLLFPFIIWKLDAGKEIIISMTEKGFGLNIGLSVLAFSTLCLSIWCIPTLAIKVFQFILDWRAPAGAKDEKSINTKLTNCLFFQLVNVYNGKDVSEDECQSGDRAYRPQLPIRYFAIAPWTLFIITCVQVFVNTTIMMIGFLLVIVSVVLVDWKKEAIVRFFERLVTKNKDTYSKEIFIRRYWILVISYYIVIIVIILSLRSLANIVVMKLLLCVLNFLFLLFFYSFLLYMENSGLKKYINKYQQRSINLSFYISNINYSILLVYLAAAVITFYYLDQYQLIEYISPIIVIVTMCTALIVFFELFFTSQFLLVKIVRQSGCETQDCSLLSNNAVVKSGKVPALKAYRFVLIGLVIIIINLYFFSSSNSHRIRITQANKDEYIADSARMPLTAYFKQWFEGRKVAGDDSVVYLISGQGGGSRAAAWFYMNMTDLCNRNPDFFDKVFCLSTVSGSSTGANMFLATKYFELPVPCEKISTITSGLYGRNYMSSAFYGLMFGDFAESIVDMAKPFPRDRNYHLQKEELNAFNETFNRTDASMFFERDYQRSYLDTPHRHWPLFLLNTTIVNFGTRALFSPVHMDSISVARDLYGEFKNNACNAHNNLPLVACVNQSQAFPILSGYNYLECIGRLGDGGISENSGCATTLEIYQKLRHYCDTGGMKNVKIICLNITNGNLDSDFKVSYEKASIFNTVAAAVNSPFDGSETYAYRNLEKQVRYLQGFSNRNSIQQNRDTVVNISLDSSVTLTRTMSKQSVEFMFRRMKSKNFSLPK